MGWKAIVGPPTPNSPRGWIAMTGYGFIDILIPPLPSQITNNELPYLYLIRNRIQTEDDYQPPLTANGLIHMAQTPSDGNTLYDVRDENNQVLDSILIPDTADLKMVTPSNTGILYSDNTNTTYIARWNSTAGKIELQIAPNLKPGAYLINGVNPIGAPFLVFVRYDSASQMAWLQVSPEPFAPTGVLWTVPTNKPFTETFTFTTETAQMPGLLHGIIYYQTSQALTAVNMHDGSLLWEIPLPGTSLDAITSPILSTPFAKIPREYIYIATQMNNKVVLSSLACCSGNGICPNKGVSTVCQCNTNYYGAACNIFCDSATCGGTNNLGGNCSVNGCQCNPGYYGSLCACNPAITCSGRGMCTPQGSCVCKSGFDFNMYSGMNCETSQINWFLVGCFAAGGVVIILLIIIIILACTRKAPKRSRKHKYEKVLTSPTE
jgi:hypothetical protein